VTIIGYRNIRFSIWIAWLRKRTRNVQACVSSCITWIKTSLQDATSLLSIKIDHSSVGWLKKKISYLSRAVLRANYQRGCVFEIRDRWFIHQKLELVQSADRPLVSSYKARTCARPQSRLFLGLGGFLSLRYEIFPRPSAFVQRFSETALME